MCTPALPIAETLSVFMLGNVEVATVEDAVNTVDVVVPWTSSEEEVEVAEAPISDADKRAVLRENAKRFYGI